MLEKNNQVDLYFRDKTDDNSVYKVRISDDGEIQFKRLSTDGMTQSDGGFIPPVMRNRHRRYGHNPVNIIKEAKYYGNKEKCKNYR